MEVTVISSSSDDFIEAIRYLETQSLLALDCEGIDLGRHGEVSIVQLSSMDRCFLFDVLGLSASSALALSLKALLEDPGTLKIIHDSKMDGDALLHKLDIRLTNVHDTQAWDKVLNGMERNLNSTLLSFDCAPNTERSADVYKENKAFWGTRPMTPLMVQWASGDVTNLFALHAAQLDRCSPEESERATAASEEQAGCLREKHCHLMNINPKQMGRFIGPKGANIRKLMDNVPGSFYRTRGKFESGSVAVYAPNESSLAQAVNSLSRYVI